MINHLHTVSLNLNKYSILLVEQGLPPELSNRFSIANKSIADVNQSQYEICSHHKMVVQNNRAQFNSLNKQLMKILHVGRIL